MSSHPAATLPAVAFDALLAAQGGHCALCPNTVGLFAEICGWCHGVRGIQCRVCQHFRRNNVAHLKRRITYLEAHEAVCPVPRPVEEVAP